MPHPTHAFAFNELSVACCTSKCAANDLLDLLEKIRGWEMNESRPLIAALRRDPTFEALARGKKQAKIGTLLLSAVNGPKRVSTSDQIEWSGQVARGFSAAVQLGGVAISWPCTCDEWSSHVVAVVQRDTRTALDCRHARSDEHLKLHWQAAVRAARLRLGRPATVLRVDGLNNSGAEVPQIHFSDGTALSVNGDWKHGRRELAAAEIDWLRAIGWVVAPATLEVR